MVAQYARMGGSLCPHPRAIVEKSTFFKVLQNQIKNKFFHKTSKEH